MARGVNKVILIGNLGRDPEARYLPQGTAVTTLSLATADKWRDKQTGEQQERTEWHRVVAFNKIAEVMGQYLKKGSKIYVEGRLQTRKWQDQSGQDRYTTEVVVQDFQMLDSRGQGQGQPQGGGGPSPAPGGEPGGAPPPDDQWDDDIPFISCGLGPLGV